MSEGGGDVAAEISFVGKTSTGKTVEFDAVDVFTIRTASFRNSSFITTAPRSYRCSANCQNDFGNTTSGGFMSRAIAMIGGTGPLGMGLALRLTRAGEAVLIGSRDAARAQEAAETIQKRAGSGAQISGLENSAAVAATDLLALTVPFEGAAALLKQLKPAFRPGSIPIDATVPLAAGVGGRASRTLGIWQGSAAQQTAELVPKDVSAGGGLPECFRRSAQWR